MYKNISSNSNGKPLDDDEEKKQNKTNKQQIK